MNETFCIRYCLKKFDGVEIKEEYHSYISVQMAIGSARRKARKMAKELNDRIHITVLGKGVHQLDWVE